MPWPHFMLTNIIGAFLWATFYGLGSCCPSGIALRGII